MRKLSEPVTGTGNGVNNVNINTFVSIFTLEPSGIMKARVRSNNIQALSNLIERKSRSGLPEFALYPNIF